MDDTHPNESAPTDSHSKPLDTPPRASRSNAKEVGPLDPMRRPDPVELRRMILKHLLLGSIVRDRDVSRFSVDDIRAALQKAIKSITIPAVSSLRDELEDKIKPAREFSQFEITVGRVNNPVTIKKDFTSVRQREEDHPVTKKRLGAALWHCLLGLKLGEWDGKWKCSESYMLPELRPRIEALRSKSSLAMLVDTGSTMAAAVDALLTMDRAALLISSPDPRRPGVARSRLLRLQLTTNSISIAATVSETNRPHSNLPVRLIGGDWRIESESICGPLADLCLQTWNFRCDLAVIGTTGTSMRDGQWWLLSEDILESRIKASFLDLSALRVVLLGYEKIDIEPRQYFAAVSSAHVDLIVVDAGRRLSSPPKKLVAFARAANRQGVSVLLIESPASEFSSRH